MEYIPQCGGLVRNHAPRFTKTMETQEKTNVATCCNGSYSTIPTARNAVHVEKFVPAGKKFRTLIQRRWKCECHLSKKNRRLYNSARGLSQTKRSELYSRTVIRGQLSRFTRRKTTKYSFHSSAAARSRAKFNCFSLVHFRWLDPLFTAKMKTRKCSRGEYGMENGFPDPDAKFRTSHENVAFY